LLFRLLLSRAQWAGSTRLLVASCGADVASVPSIASVAWVPVSRLALVSTVPDTSAGTVPGLAGLARMGLA
jgi:hypothetical protein